MPSHSETQQLPYQTHQLFEMVSDVAAYEQFLPWCVGSRVMSQQDNIMLAELQIGYKQLREAYVSEVTLLPAEAPHAPCEIKVRLVKGPFHNLTNHWRFTPHGEMTVIEFDLDFKFRSRLLGRIMEAFFFQAMQQMVGAFKRRAAELYG